MAETRMPLGVSHAMTQEGFRALPEGPPDFEFEYGALIAMPRPHGRHQDIVAAFATYTASIRCPSRAWAMLGRDRR